MILHRQQWYYIKYRKAIHLLNLAIEGGKHICMQGIAQIITYTYGMILIKIIIESDASVYTARIGIRVLIILLRPYGIGKAVCSRISFCKEVVLIKTDHSENIKTVMPIVYIGLLYKV